MTSASHTVPGTVATSVLAAFSSQALAETAALLDCQDAAAIATLLHHLGDEQAASLFADQHQEQCPNTTHP